MQQSKIRFDQLVAIARRTIPFLADDGRAFVHIPLGHEGRRVYPVRSDAFRDWFLMIAFGEHERVPTHHQFTAICRHLEAEARREEHNTGIAVSRRVAALDAKIHIDLANPAGEFIEVDADGYRVSAANGAPFETSAATLPLPAPEPPESAAPGALHHLRTLLRLGPADAPAWLRCLTWLLCAFRAEGPFPVLVLRGPAASGKSLAARILRVLVDPCTSQFTPTPRTASQLFTLARQNWVLAFDHVAGLTPHLCHALCRLTSGAGIAVPEPGRREPVQQFLRRPILITVTGDFILPPELASRALVVDLPALTPETRRLEQDLRDTVGAALPQILAALCDALSRALAIPPKLVPTLTRHADALAWICAAFPHLEVPLRAAIDEPPPPHPVVAAVHTLLTATPQWTGSATDLVKRLHVGPTPRALSAYLRDSVLDLADAAIDVDFNRLPGGPRVIHLRSFASQPASETRAHPRPPDSQLLAPNSQLLAPDSCFPPPTAPDTYDPN